MPETYLHTAYKDCEHVKSLGARWNAERKQWYVPEGRDLVVFATWLPDEHRAALNTTQTAGATELTLPTKGIRVLSQ